MTAHVWHLSLDIMFPRSIYTVSFTKIPLLSEKVQDLVASLLTATKQKRTYSHYFQKIKTFSNSKRFLNSFSEARTILGTQTKQEHTKKEATELIY